MYPADFGRGRLPLWLFRFLLAAPSTSLLPSRSCTSFSRFRSTRTWGPPLQGTWTSHASGSSIPTSLPRDSPVYNTGGPVNRDSCGQRSMCGLHMAYLDRGVHSSRFCEIVKITAQRHRKGARLAIGNLVLIDADHRHDGLARARYECFARPIGFRDRKCALLQCHTLCLDGIDKHSTVNASQNTAIARTRQDAPLVGDDPGIAR